MAIREEALAVMREIREASDRYRARGSFDETLKADCLMEFLRHLSQGATPRAAEYRTKEYARECIKRHKARSWEGTADIVIELAFDKVERVFTCEK